MRIELLKFLEWYHERMDMPLEDNEIIYVDEYLAQKQTEVNKSVIGDVSKSVCSHPFAKVHRINNNIHYCSACDKYI
jgi:hypothetical protein